MSKIICDVCGTSYPETATQCPICGCVRPGEVHSVAGDNQEKAVAASAYNHTKGGHFSKSNVKKRSHTVKSGNKDTVAAKKANPDKNDGSKGLVITALLLVLAIIAVVVYIAVRFFLPGLDLNKPNGDGGDSGVITTAPSTEAEINCTGLTLDVVKVVFNAEGESRMIYPSPIPANTTDDVKFESSDESVVTVSAEGKLTAVAPGTATITVTCGIATANCEVDCTFLTPTETTAPTVEDTTPEDTTVPEDTTAPAETGFKLNRKDITFSRKGDSWIIYDGTLPLSSITWTSDDETIATITNGKVEAVGSGTTEVHGEYDGEKASCIIRCSFKEEDTGVGGTGGVSEDGGGSGSSGGVSEDGGNADGAYKIYTGFGDEVSDVSIKAGESFTLQLKNEAGEYVSVTWSAADEAVCSVSDNKITGVAAGVTTVSATHDGATYSCVVRVK